MPLAVLVPHVEFLPFAEPHPWRHLSSFPMFGIEAHGFWTAKEDAEPRLFVLASYAAGEEPGEVTRRYMHSKEFAEDIRNFDVSDIVGVESTILIPSTSSPLK